MSVCTFIAANCPMDEVRPSKEYPLKIDLDEGTIYDGDADDNFSLRKFREVFDYTDKQYGVSLEWAYYKTEKFFSIERLRKLTNSSGHKDILNLRFNTQVYYNGHVPED